MNRAGRAAHDARAQGTQVETVEKRVVQHGDVHRRHAVDRRALFLFDGRQHLYRVETLHENQRHALVQGAQNAQNAPETVEKRHGHAKAVLDGEILRERDPETVVGDVAVGKLHAFRETRRAARILHVDDIVDVQFGLTREIVRVGHFLGEILDFVQRIHAAVLRAAHEKNALEMGKRRGLQHAARHCAQLRHEIPHDFREVAIAITFDDDEILRTGLLQGEIQFVLLVVRVERQENRAYFRRGQHQHHPVRHIRRPERDLFASLDAQRHQAARHQIDFAPQLEPGQAVVPVGENERIVRAAPGDRLVQELADRVLARQRQVVPGHAARDALRERRLNGRRTVRIR